MGSDEHGLTEITSVRIEIWGLAGYPPVAQEQEVIRRVTDINLAAELLARRGFRVRKPGRRQIEDEGILLCGFAPNDIRAFVYREVP